MKTLVITDGDLDGLGAYLVWTWFKGEPTEVIFSLPSALEATVKRIQEQDLMSQYDEVWTLDLDVGDHITTFDHPHANIVDHHDTHVERKGEYQVAVPYVVNFTSTAKLLYLILSKKHPDIKLTKSQKRLIGLVDDYDSYQLRFEDSYKLNLLFFYTNTRVEKFREWFANGFTGFNEEQSKIINFHTQKITQVLGDLEFFTATLPVGDKKIKFVSTFASQYINEVADHALRTTESDVVMVINLDQKKVSYRKNPTCSLNMGKIAQKWGDGGGHHAAAGSALTDNVLTIAGCFEPYDVTIRSTREEGNQS